MIPNTRALHLAVRNGVPQQNPAVAEFESGLFAWLDTLPRAESVTAIRALGAVLPDEPTEAELSSAWQRVQQALPARLAAFWAASDSAGTSDPAQVADHVAMLANCSRRYGELIASLEGHVDTSDGAAVDAYVREALASHERLPAVKASIADLEQRQVGVQLNALIRRAQAERKWTPAIEASLRAALASGDVTLKGAEAWLLGRAPVLPTAKFEAGPANTSGRLAWNGKTFPQLTGAERAALLKEDPELYAQMRNEVNP